MVTMMAEKTASKTILNKKHNAGQIKPKQQ